MWWGWQGDPSCWQTRHVITVGRCPLSAIIPAALNRAVSFYCASGTYTHRHWRNYGRICPGRSEGDWSSSNVNRSETVPTCSVHATSSECRTESLYKAGNKCFGVQMCGSRNKWFAFTNKFRAAESLKMLQFRNSLSFCTHSRHVETLVLTTYYYYYYYGSAVWCRPWQTPAVISYV